MKTKQKVLIDEVIAKIYAWILRRRGYKTTMDLIYDDYPTGIFLFNRYHVVGTRE